MDMNSILDSIPELLDLFDEREVDYVLVGGIALLSYIEGRNTQDIDFIVPKSAVQKLPEIQIEESNTEFARGFFGDLRVDFLFTSNKLFKYVAVKETVARTFHEREVSTATVPGLLLLKLFSFPSLYRQGRFDKVRTYEKDVSELLVQLPEKQELDPLLNELAKHLLPSDFEEVRKIVEELQERIARSKTRFQDPPS